MCFQHLLNERRRSGRTAFSSRRWLWLGALGLALGLFLASCSSRASPPPSVAEYNSFLAASQFVVGENRFPFVLMSNEGERLEGAAVRVRFAALRGKTADVLAEASAVFREIKGTTPHLHEGGQVHEHTEAKAAYFVDRVQFDRPGIWLAEFDVQTSSGQAPKVPPLAFEVQQSVETPQVGHQVLSTRNLTRFDVPRIEEICTRVPPDDMHDLSVAQALEQRKPLVVVFSTPMFCISRVCGPVTDIAAEVHSRYRGRVNFIHIEPWELSIARSEGRLVPTQIMREWKLPSEPWVFVANSEGIIVARYEGLVSAQELEESILKAVASSPSRPGGA